VDQTSAHFTPGLELSQAFYKEAVKPILDLDFRDFKYSAALIGSGSEVLGFDTELSSDHHWGPRVMLFVTPEDLPIYETSVRQILSEKLPRKFKGYSTSFTNPQEKGIQILEYKKEGPINHRVEITSIEKFIKSYLNFDIRNEIEPADWLTFPEQKLLSITSGKVFHDEIGLEKVRDKFKYYPHDVWLYMLTSCWTRIEQEEHLMGRAGDAEDEIGSAIIASRLVRDLMRLCFLMEKCYAPYPKWFGIAFSKLQAANRLEPILKKVLSSNEWKKREEHLSDAYEYVAQLHNQLNITEPMATKVSSFFDRPFLVISKGTFSKAISAKITDSIIKTLIERPLIGNIDLLSDNTDVLYNPRWREAFRELYIK
jgi:hypothetical protein